jgi:Winged helix DNA-binding domain
MLRERLVNQKLAGAALHDPQEIISWFGAVQAQDFQGARWAVGLRSKSLTAAAVERAFDEGRILRTHVLRPTWHFVTAEDIRWLIALSGPRIIARLAYRHRWLELDAGTMARSRAALIRALESRHLTRRELAAVLQRAGVASTPERLSHLLMVAELEGLVCSGPLRDRQLTYALVDERVPRAAPLDAEQALARLADRYFTSHGPATLADFSWWSGLSRREARAAVERAGSALSRDVVGSGTFRAARPRSRARIVHPSAWLLPNFDEYLVAYKDRAAVFGDRPVSSWDTLTHTVIIDGLAAATWRPRRQNGSVSIDVWPRRRLTGDELDQIRGAGDRYGAFVGRAVAIERPAARREARGVR